MGRPAQRTGGNRASGANAGGGSQMKRSLAWFVKSLFILALGGTVLGSALVGVVFWHFSQNLPKIISVADYRPLVTTRIYAGTGPRQAVVGEFFKERRYVIPYEKMPELIIKAFISAEDDSFFEHQGINLASMARAAIANFRAGHSAQGGSTITQQLVKMLLLTPEKSYVRKIKEGILAHRIEGNLTKQQILYLYLNQIYLGHGAYGVQSAATTYFRKDAAQVSLAEAALIAGLPQAPGKYSPLLNPKRAKERQLYVLRRMYENRYITQAEMTAAAAQPLRVYHDDDINRQTAPYLVEHVRRHLVDKYGEKAVYEDGLSVYLPAPPDVSRQALTSLREGLRLVDQRIGYRGPIQKIRKADETEAFVKKARLELIRSKLGFETLTPDGKLDPIEPIKMSGRAADWELLDEGEVYKAIVTGFDAKRKVARLLIGAARAEMSADKMKWAKPGIDQPSRLLSIGDVVMAKVIKTGDPVQLELSQEPEVQGALLSMEAQTGHVVAMVGGYDFDKSEFNRAIQAQRQPGSAFKPFVYSLALEKGYTPTSIIVDSPLVFGDNDGNKWKPANYEEKFYGDTTFRQSLIKSRNIPTVKIVQDVQISNVIAYAKRLGFTSQFSEDMSTALGSSTTSLLDLVRVYSLFPRLGRRVEPIFIAKVVDRDGKVLEESVPTAFKYPTPVTTSVPENLGDSDSPKSVKAPEPIPSYPPDGDPDQLMDPRIAYLMTHLMTEVVSYGTGAQAQGLGRPVAGKTGTTNDYIDAWFMGFTPNLVTGVWVGFDNQKTINPGETGAKAALPIWLSYMKEAVKDYTPDEFAIPDGISFAWIDQNTGKQTAPKSKTGIVEAFLAGTEPQAGRGQQIGSGGATGRGTPSGDEDESQNGYFREE